MSFDPLSAALELGTSVINKIWPDPVKQAEEQRKLQELYQKGDLAELNAYVQVVLGQLEVNKVEAAHKSIFVAGGRPFIIWVGGASLAYAGIIHPLLMWVWSLMSAFGHIPAGMEPPPYVESGLLGTIVTGLLGVGGMRSFDKSKGVETNAISTKK